MNDRTIRVRVPSETFDALSAEAAAEGETLAGFLRPLLIKRGVKAQQNARQQQQGASR